MTHPYIAPMLEILSDTFRRFTGEPAPQELVKRRDLLRSMVLQATGDTIYDGLSDNAMKSLGFCAFSNYSKARKVFDTPGVATRNSTAILGVARLTHGGEKNIQANDVATDLDLGIEVLFPEMLVPQYEPEPHLVLHDYYSKKLAIMRMEGHGCPAHGSILNNMYRRYVDVVFAPVIEQEVQARATADV